jgi:acyl carrier protein
MSATANTIREILIALTGNSTDSFPPDANLYLDLGVASAHALRLLAEIEERFTIAIPDEEFVEASSINDLAALVNKLKTAQDSASV